MLLTETDEIIIIKINTIAIQSEEWVWRKKQHPFTISLKKI